MKGLLKNIVSVIIILVGITTYAAQTTSNQDYQINGVKVKVESIIMNGTVYAEMYRICEELGISCDYHRTSDPLFCYVIFSQSKKQLGSFSGDIGYSYDAGEVCLTDYELGYVSEDYLKANLPIKCNGTFYLPIEVFAKAFNYDVTYASGVICINSDSIKTTGISKLEKNLAKRIFNGYIGTPPINSELPINSDHPANHEFTIKDEVELERQIVFGKSGYGIGRNENRISDLSGLITGIKNEVQVHKLQYDKIESQKVEQFIEDTYVLLNECKKMYQYNIDKKYDKAIRGPHFDKIKDLYNHYVDAYYGITNIKNMKIDYRDKEKISTQVVLVNRGSKLPKSATSTNVFAGTHPGEYWEITIDGAIQNLQLVTVNAKDLKLGYPVIEFGTIFDRTIIVDCYGNEGIPSEALVWVWPNGKQEIVYLGSQLIDSVKTVKMDMN